MVTKLTRSRGFELGSCVQDATTVGQLQTLIEEDLKDPSLWLHKLEYRGGGDVRVLGTSIRVNLTSWGQKETDLQLWMQSQLPLGHHPDKPFKGMKKGEWWEVHVDGEPRSIKGVFVPAKVIPGLRLKLSYQLALLLHIYGPLSPATAARGLDVSEQQVKGAAAALSRKALIVKGKEPYTPHGWSQTASSSLTCAKWLNDELGDRIPAWVGSLLKDPSPVRERAREPKRQRG